MAMRPRAEPPPPLVASSGRLLARMDLRSHGEYRGGRLRPVLHLPLPAGKCPTVFRVLYAHRGPFPFAPLTRKGLGQVHQSCPHFSSVVRSRMLPGFIE